MARDPRSGRSTGAGAGRHCRAGASGAAGGELSRRPQSGAAARGRELGRAGAGARRRRHRQDARAHRAHRPYPRHRPRPAERDPRRHLHQQGGARDEAPRRGDRRRRGRGHAVARHLPLDRRENPAPPRRAGRPQARFHHPRRRRSDPAAEAAPRGREHRREALAGARAGDADRRLEEPRAHARAGAAGRGRRLRQRQGAQALQGVSGAAENPQRRRFRRSASGEHPPVPRAPEVLRQYQARFRFILVDEYQDTNVAQYLWLRLLAQKTSQAASANSTSPRVRGEVDARSAAGEGAPALPERAERPPHPNPLPASGEREEQTERAPSSPARGEAIGSRPAQKTSAASATTTSRSTAGAAPRSTTSCASSTIFPAPR